jgi:hypothetical protein
MGILKIFLSASATGLKKEFLKIIFRAVAYSCDVGNNSAK